MIERKAAQLPMKTKIPPQIGIKRTKALYLAPQIETLPLKLEYGIASASAVVRPPTGTGEIKTEWETGTDRTADLDW
ncbi:hypothetical protein [Sphingobacterium kitahiroshimense]|uniref:Uncharacterized protein n=1 Tax=Sphingobacterium kitahiroshimense TaxID=470446 RepID=A0ABV0BWH3_9SPHI